MSDLGSILRLEYGAALSAQNRTGWGYPVFGSNGEVGRHARSLIPEPGIVVGRKGSVGQVSWADEPFWPIDTAYWVDCRPGDRRWLFWLLSYLPLKRLDSSTGVPGLNRNDVYALQVFRPETDARDKITEILDTLDAAIRGTEAVVAKLKAMKRGLVHDLLTRGIDANGDLRPPQPEAPDLYKQTPLGWLPKEWDAVELDDLVDNRRPVVYGILMPGHRYEGGVPVIKVRDIIDGQILSEQLLLTDPRIDFEYRRSRLKGGDLLFTIRGSVGRMAIVPDSLENANITQDTARLAIRGTDARFVAAYLEAEYPKRFIVNHTIGVAVQGINLRDVRRIPIAKPPNGEDVIIADMISELDRKLRLELSELDKLRLQKSGLMDDLLTGRVSVTPLL